MLLGRIVLLLTKIVVANWPVAFGQYAVLAAAMGQGVVEALVLPELHAHLISGHIAVVGFFPYCLSMTAIGEGSR